MAWFSKLELVEIVHCPNLSSLPCIPWSSAMYTTKISQVGSSLKHLELAKFNSGYSLYVEGNNALDSASALKVLSFPNLSKLVRFNVTRCPPLSLDNLLMLSSLKTLIISESSNAFLVPEGDGQVGYKFPVEHFIIQKSDVSGEALTRMLSYFPNLCHLEARECEMLTGLSVVGQHKKTGAPERLLLPSAVQVEEKAQIVPHVQQQDDTSEEEEIAATSEGLLLLPPQLQKLVISKCPNLVLCTDSLDDDKDADAGQTGSRGGWGLQGLRSLRSLVVVDCLRFLPSYLSSSSSTCFPFPTSLEHLSLRGKVGTTTLLPLSNLTSLTELFISGCGELRGEGLLRLPLLAQGRLTKLTVYKTPNFFAGSKPSLPHEQVFPSSSSKLQELQTDDVAGVLAAPICTLLSSSLTRLYFYWNEEVERFTKEQEEALHLLISLEEIRFWWCGKLQGLPAGLHRLPNLKRLDITGCAAMRSLHGLPSSLQELEIKDCPAIRSLPKVNDLPSSLRELQVLGSKSAELRRQCRKLIGIIPIVNA